jgi:hypothetical protein
VGNAKKRLDWKSHKIMCALIKLMPDALVPFSDVHSIVMFILLH